MLRIMTTGVEMGKLELEGDKNGEKYATPALVDDLGSNT